MYVQRHVCIRIDITICSKTCMYTYWHNNVCSKTCMYTY